MKAHEVTHRHNPRAGVVVNGVCACKKNIFSALYVLNGLQQGRPKRVSNGLWAVLFVKRMHAPPVPVGRGVLCQGLRNVVGRCAR